MVSGGSVSRTTRWKMARGAGCFGEWRSVSRTTKWRMAREEQAALATGGFKLKALGISEIFANAYGKKKKKKKKKKRGQNSKTGTVRAIAAID